MGARHRGPGRRDARDLPLGRVLHGIAGQLVPDSRLDVDVAVVRYLQQVKQHIGDFLADVLLDRWISVGEA